MPNYNGADTFTYTIQDNGTTNGVADPLQIEQLRSAVTVTEVNDAPTAKADTTTVAEDGTVNINVLGNDSKGPAGNESGQTLTVVSATARARHGDDRGGRHADLHAGRELQRRRHASATRSRTTAPPTASPIRCDRAARSAVTVTEVNDAPTAIADTTTVAEDGTVNINVLGD